MPTRLGRYELVGVLGHGGMATVYLANVGGEGGFSRLVALKLLHPHLAEQDDFVSMFLDEARLAARIHHPNVVPVVDLQAGGPYRYIVMEYVEGCALSDLLRKNRGNFPSRILVRLLLDTLHGLHAAHTLTDPSGAPLNLIHRDVSPQNILVGVDGTARLTDFGVAQAQWRIHHTRQREIKGKLAFMAPEQLRSLPIDLRADIFSVGCLMWLAITGKSLFLGENDVATLSNVVNRTIVPPSSVNPGSPQVLDAICLRALERDPERRWSNAAEMEEALREIGQSADLIASRRETADWVEKNCRRELTERRSVLRDFSSARIDISAGSGSASVRLGALAQPLDASPTVVSPAGAGAAPGANRNAVTPARRPARFLWAAGLTAVALGAVVAGVALRGSGGTRGAGVAPGLPARSIDPTPPVVAPLPVTLTEIRPVVAAEIPVEAPSPPEPAVAEETIAPSPARSHWPKRVVRPTARPTARPMAPRRAAAVGSPAAPPPAPSPSHGTARPKAATWDKDSPLPPM